MTRNKIRKDEFEEWALKQWIIYASEGVPRNKKPQYRDLLRFRVCLSGGFRTTLAEKILYEGESFSEAASAYHDAWQ